jgi:uncharacterized protein with HEPN domain
MRKDDRIRLRHMLDAAREAIEFAQNSRRQDLDSDRKLTLASNTSSSNTSNWKTVSSC